MRRFRRRWLEARIVGRFYVAKALEADPVLPRLPLQALAVTAFTWALQRYAAGPISLVALTCFFLVWVHAHVWKTTSLEAARIRVELKPALQIAERAQGGSVGERSADGGSVAKAFGQSQAVLNFDGVRRRTHCAFASAASLWGNDWQAVDGADGAEVDSHAALLYNLALCLPRFHRFCIEVRNGRPIDGFVFEARGASYGSDVESFARTVRCILETVSAADPAGVHCMKRSYIDRKGWYFQFAREPLFVTTFAPCYGEANPRYQFGESPGSCFVLFQPEESFLRHDLPSDRPRSATNWEKPADVRDRIRVNFKRHGREYKIPEVTAYPPSEFIVAAADVLQDPPVRFWKAGLPGASGQCPFRDATGEGAAHT